MPNPVPETVSIVGELEPMPFVTNHTYTFEVTLNESDTSPVVVALSCTSGVFDTFPSSVTVPANATSAQFQATTLSSFSASGVTITASTSGGSISVTFPAGSIKPPH